METVRTDGPSIDYLKLFDDFTDEPENELLEK